jgi:pimeloyl-ACP methyl ester carboxylesterase
MLTAIATGGLAAAGLYGAAAAVLMAAERRLLYWPVAPDGDPARGLPGGFRLERRPGPAGDLMTWRHDGDPAKATVVYFHGNASTLAASASRLERLAAAGHGVRALEYRGFAGVPGRPDEAGLTADAAALVAQVVAETAAAADGGRGRAGGFVAGAGGAAVETVAGAAGGALAGAVGEAVAGATGGGSGDDTASGLGSGRGDGCSCVGGTGVGGSGIGGADDGGAHGSSERRSSGPGGAGPGGSGPSGSGPGGAGGVAVYGWSLGASVALAATAATAGTLGAMSGTGAGAAVRALVLETPALALVDVAAERYPLFPVRRMMRDRWDGRAAAARLAMPALLLVGDRDRTIPPRHSLALAARLAGPVTVRRHAEGGHIDLDHHGAVAAIVAFLAGLDRADADGATAGDPAAPR